MSERYFLVMNPGSRSGQARELWPRIVDLLTERGVKYGFALTETMGDGRRLAWEAVEAGFERVVAVGGDGTIQEVMDGIMGDDGRSRVPFAVLYTGTSPDFCRWHRIPLDMEEAVLSLLHSPPRRVDICRISHRDPLGQRCLRHFACSANFGLGAAIARGSNSGWRLRFGDSLGTFFSTLEAVLRHRADRFVLRIDGERQCFDRTWNIFVGKNPHIASGICLDLPIKPDDGRLFLVALHGLSRAGLLARLPRAYTGSFSRLFPPRFARRVDILHGEGAEEVEYDGDPRGFLPASIEVLHGGLTLLGSAG